MHVGYAPVFQNLGRKISDYETYRGELRLVDLAEPLGFDSIWEPEHHFTDYEMTPDVLQFLAYCAGRTRHVRLGSMVWCCRGTIRCASPSRSCCSTSSPTGAPSLASAAA